MKEIIDSIDSRIKSPLFGYYIIAVIAWNWDPFFYLFFDSGSASERIAYFRANTSHLTVFIWPTLLACLYSVIYPWINYLFLWCSQKPNEYKNTLQARSKDKLLTIQQQLEQKRANLIAQREEELIAQAKRDKEIEEIGDLETKKELKEKLEALRVETQKKQQLDSEQEEILIQLSQYFHGLTEDDFYEILNGPEIKNQYHIETLQRLGYIEYPDIHNNYTYKLTAGGRAYLVETGLV